MTSFSNLAFSEDSFDVNAFDLGDPPKIKVNNKFVSRVNAVTKATDINAVTSGTRINAKINITRVK